MNDAFVFTQGKRWISCLYILV